MFQEIRNKLKAKKRHLQDSVSFSSDLEEKGIPFEIQLSKEKNLFKMEISDDISIADYVERMRLIDNFGLESLICNAVLWNSSKQKVNKGLYYVIPIGNRLYNIFKGDNYIKIDERIKESDITEEKIISLEVESNDYSYTFHKHDSTGNTFYTRFFNKRGFCFGKLELSEEEFTESVVLLIHNLESIDDMRNIIDIELLRRNLLDVPENKRLQKSRK